MVAATQAPVLEVEGLKVHFPINRGVLFMKSKGAVKAVDGVSLAVSPRETLGLVGESGSGKTTVGRAIIRLLKPTAGRVLFEGEDVASLGSSRLRQYRRRIGVVFQDPFGSLNPRMTAGKIIGEPLVAHGLLKNKADRRARINELLETVGLSASMASRYPHEFSGGQRQRIGIARAIAADPALIILDEPVSALDVSIQAQIINLLEELQARLNIAYLFIAHDLSVVRHVSDRVAVMYLGKLMEIADRDVIYEGSRHPYTQALLSAVPVPDPDIEATRERTVLVGDIPSPANPPSGCVFRTRCPIADEGCAETVPPLREIAPGHQIACLKV